MKVWDKIPLSTICTPAERFITPTAGEVYRQLGVRLWGEGTYEREQIDGADTKYGKFNRIDVDDLVVNKIWARNGAVGVANREHANTFVSSEFPVFVLDKLTIEPEWMRLVTKWPGFWKLCDEKAQGTSGKNRIKPSQFLAISIPLPSLVEQRILINRITDLTEKAKQIESHLVAVERDAEHLLALRFSDAIANAPQKPMAIVAPSIRRPVKIDMGSRYREVGARSFGKGLFVKPDFDGAEATWQKPVWIKSGDLVLSNIKAWEGAIAVAGHAHENFIASHRYITCVPDTTQITADFLAYYLLSEEGMEKIGRASPGTADRNRTLSLGNLAKLEVPTPALDVQITFNRLQSGVAALKARHNAIRQANAALLPAMLERIFSQATGEYDEHNQ